MQAPRPLGVHPASGPVEGRTRLEVRGSGLRGGDRYRCRFEWGATAAEEEGEGMAGGGGVSAGNVTTEATLDTADGGLLRCVAPPLAAAANASLRVALNAQ